MTRYCTYETYSGKVVALTEEEFNEAGSVDNHASPDDVADWVWQYANSLEQAISQHANKVDEWFENTDKETY